MRAVLAALLLLAAPGPAPAAPDGPRIGLELNRLEPTEGACRVWLVLDNAGEALETLELDLVLFDAQGLIRRRLAVDAGPLRAGREAVKAFTLDGLDCEAIGRVLVNGAPACAGPGATADCLGRIEASSRAGVDLVN